MPFLRYLLGRPLCTEEEGEQRVGVLAGVAVFGLDALGSAAYGPEAALTVLIPVGALALRYVVGLSTAITLLLLVVFLSYRQTIGAYPNGGGAYTVAGQNLGPRVGMLAGAALMLDYLLNVCVGISTGVGALVSAAPKLKPHTLGICLTILAAILLANLRGVREAGFLWMAPTYLFVGCLLAVTVWISMTLNGIGAAATGITTLIVFVAKFASGAWLSVAVLLVLLLMLLLMLSSVRRHYDRVERYTHVTRISLNQLPNAPLMLVPVSRWNRATLAGLQLACSLSEDVRVLHMADVAEQGDATCEEWQCELDEAAQSSGIPAPKVASICSPYRSVTGPIMEYVKGAEREKPGRKIAVVIAEIVAPHWYQQVMHNYRAMLLRLRLFLEGNRRVVIVNLPWQLPPG